MKIINAFIVVRESSWKPIPLKKKIISGMVNNYIWQWRNGHTGLTREWSIRFLIFEIKRVLVFNSIIIYFTGLFNVLPLNCPAFLFKVHMPAKKYLRKKAKKLCLMGQLVIESHSFLEYWRRTVKSTCGTYFLCKQTN